MFGSCLTSLLCQSIVLYVFVLDFCYFQLCLICLPVSVVTSLVADFISLGLGALACNIIGPGSFLLSNHLVNWNFSESAYSVMFDNFIRFLILCLCYCEYYVFVGFSLNR